MALAKAASKKQQSKSGSKQTVKKADVLAYLKKNQDARGIAHWKKHKKKSGGLSSCGIGLTRLRKYAKSLPTDAKLAGQLWNTKLYEARILGLLIDDPKQMTVEQAEAQVEQLQGGYLAHVFSTCGAPLAKTPFVVALVDKWVKSKDAMRRGCGYGLLYEVAKDKRKSAPDDDYFLEHIKRIDKTHSKQPVPVRMAMATALMGIGLRNKKLNKPALNAARAIGPIDFDPDGRCDPFDVCKHLTGAYAKKKLGL